MAARDWAAAPLSLVLFTILLLHVRADAARTRDGSEEWGYVEVRPGAHLFWWLYRSPHRVDSPSSPWPTVLWLQGGPGASGVGIGNFEEIGPLDTELKPRNSTWLQFADLLFVDNPVGTGYSFVEDEAALVKTDEEVGKDLVVFLRKVFNGRDELRQSPLFIVAESYGGKYAVSLALAAVDAIRAGQLKLRLGGVALGDSWISPEDFVFAWGPLLGDVSRLDLSGVEKANRMAEKIKQQIRDGQFGEATHSWGLLEDVILAASNSVDLYNFLLDSGMDPVSETAAVLVRSVAARKYSNYLASKASTANSGDLGSLMEGPIRSKLKIIPENVTWGGQSELVFKALRDDFMKPRIAEVDELLSRGVSVTVYNGQLDVICATKGAESWLQKLKWEGLKNFNELTRTPIFCDDAGATKGFTKSYKNLRFYWILGAGHFVPVDQPCTTLKMLREITRSHEP
ncbi:serine carboxypeptidase-like 51 [Wolffia australiana]